MDYNQLKKLNGIEPQTNIALMNWDPIGVQKSGEFAHNIYLEYARYVSLILDVIQDEEKLQSLIWIIATDITGFDEKNLSVVEEVNKLIERLIEIRDEAK